MISGQPYGRQLIEIESAHSRESAIKEDIIRGYEDCMVGLFKPIDDV